MICVPASLPGSYSKAAHNGGSRATAAASDHHVARATFQGPGPLHLASVFGVDPKTAIRYAENARMLLVTAAVQQDPASSHEPTGQNRS